MNRPKEERSVHWRSCSAHVWGEGRIAVVDLLQSSPLVRLRVTTLALQSSDCLVAVHCQVQVRHRGAGSLVVTLTGDLSEVART